MEPVTNSDITKTDIDRLPRFENLVAQLLEPPPRVQLVFDRLLKDGKGALLAPVQENNSIDRNMLDDDSLPTLDLTEAGIDWDRTEPTVRRHVNELLKGHFFTIRPFGKELFDPFLYITAWVEALGFVAQANIVKMAVESRVFRPGPILGPKPPYDAKAALARARAHTRARSASLTLETVGEPVPGLDLSKPVSGWRGEMMLMLFPAAEAKYQLLQKAAYCWWNLGDLGYYERTTLNGWWFWLIPNWWRKRQIHWRQDLFKSSLSEYETARAALPA